MEMSRFERTVDCAATCDLFKTREEKENLEKILRKRIGRRGGTMCSRTSQILHRLGAIPSDLSVYSILGQGQYGTVLGVCNKGSRSSSKMALKITTDSEHSRLEIDMQHRFQAIGLAPSVHSVSHSKGNTFILMDHVDMTIESYLMENNKTISVGELTTIFDEIEDAVDTMYDNNLSHGDMHMGNVAVILDDDGSYKGITFIDFGFSSGRDDSSIITKELQVLREYVQLLRSTTDLGDLEDETRRIVMQRLNKPDLVEIRQVFQVGEDLEHNEKTQDDTFELVHEFFLENGIWK